MGVKLVPYQGLDCGSCIPGWEEMSSFASDTTISNSTYFSLVMEGSVSELSGFSTPRPSKYVCAYCEGSWQVPVGFEKSGEMKMLEDIASDHFKKRVLRAEEISLNDTMSIADDIDRCVQLLNSVVLCDSCIYKFSSNEAKILMAQDEYLKRMTGPKEFGDLLGDPWLDLKRYAYAKLKSQQESITEKLSLINISIPRDMPSSFTSANGPGTGLLSIGVPGSSTSETIMQQVFVPPLKYPPSSTSAISIDVSTDTDQFPAATCQFAVSSEASNSSGASSPVGVGQGRETRKSVQSPSDYESAEDHVSHGGPQPPKAVPPTLTGKPIKNEGSSVSTMIVPPAMSPVVNLKPISSSTSQDQNASKPGKAPEPSSSSTNKQQGGKKVARKLTMELEEVDEASVVKVSKEKLDGDGHKGVSEDEEDDSDSSDDDDQKKSTNSSRRQQPDEDEDDKNDTGIAKFQPLRVESSSSPMPIKPAHLPGPASLVKPQLPPPSKRGRAGSSKPKAGPRRFFENTMNDDDDGSSSDGNSSVRSSASTRSRSTRSRNSPVKPRRNSEGDDTPDSKRAKLDPDSLLRKTSMHKTSTPAVFAKKSAPPPPTASPVAKRTPQKSAAVKLPAPVTASTPKDNPKNKASTKAAKAPDVDVNKSAETGKIVPTKASAETEKAKKDPAKTIAGKSRKPLPKSKSKSPDKNDRKGKLIGNRVLHEDSGSSDDPDDSDDSGSGSD